MRGSAGGKAAAPIFRKAAEDAYYKNPNKCLHCDSVIHPEPGRKIQMARRKKFCNSSCSATYHNKKRWPQKDAKKQESITCSMCKSEFVYMRGRNTRGYTRKFCDGCLPITICGPLRGQQTKGQIFANAKNWQSARSGIRAHAKAAYDCSGRENKCAICGYSVHVQIAHIKAVSAFPDEAMLTEINHPDNLIGLCPNHHWEFDHGYLNLSQ